VPFVLGELRSPCFFRSVEKTPLTFKRAISEAASGSYASHKRNTCSVVATTEGKAVDFAVVKVEQRVTVRQPGGHGTEDVDSV
jgi:hypothetical protein